MTRPDENRSSEGLQCERPLAGFRIGDHVRLPSIDCTFEVIGLADPLLVLRAPSGRELRAGWRAVQRIRTRSEIQRQGGVESSEAPKQ